MIDGPSHIGRAGSDVPGAFTSRAQASVAGPSPASLVQRPARALQASQSLAEGRLGATMLDAAARALGKPAASIAGARDGARRTVASIATSDASPGSDAIAGVGGLGTKRTATGPSVALADMVLRHSSDFPVDHLDDGGKRTSLQRAFDAYIGGRDIVAAALDDSRVQTA